VTRAPSSRPSGGWLAFPRQVEEAALRVILCPYAGGGVASWRSWLPLLPADVEVGAYRFPGRESRLREQPVKSIAAAVDACVEATGRYLDVPLVIFGHSLGGLIAYEVAHGLHARYGTWPQLLAVSATAAPHVPRPPDRLSQLPTDVFMERLRSGGNIDPRLACRQDLLRILVPMLRADFEIGETYQYLERGPVVSDLLVLMGDADPTPGAGDMEAWRRHAARGFACRRFPGRHFYLVAQERDVVSLLLESADYETRSSEMR
jgi:medium-chain acyl-[acyl-carrier-protein] hydrolase